jgi:hypothetical protein
LKQERVTGFSTLRDGFILIVEAHVCDAADVLARMKEAKGLAANSGLRRIVVDATHVVSVWRDRDLAGLTEMARQDVGWADRIGLARGSGALTDKFRALVDSFAEAGVPIRMFKTVDQARAWVMS